MSLIDSQPPRRSRPAPLDVSVARVEPLGGGFVRVTLGGESLAAFTWPGAASHLKFFPPAGEELPAAAATDDAPPARPTSRTYTPRSFEACSRELAIDFLLHGEGPASSWASDASPGDRVRVSIARASYRIDPAATWLLLAGDDSAIPAIATILESVANVPTTVIVETISEEADRLCLPEHSLASVVWLSAEPTSPGSRLQAAVHDWPQPAAAGAIWVACEALAVRRIRQDLLEDRHVDPATLVTRGYWRQGAVNHPDHDFGEDLLDS